MDLMEVVNKVCRETLDEVAQKVEADMKAVADEHFRSGAAYRAIHIEAPDDRTRLIGGFGGEGTRHLVWLDQGNGGSGSRIYPKNSKMLRIKDKRGNTVAFASSVRAYGGIHFLKSIADKYR